MAVELAAAALGGTGTILVAEDNGGVRDTVVSMLVELGYRVLKAKDGSDALDVWRAACAPTCCSPTW